MFSFVGIIALLFFIFIRPQEIFPALQELPLIYIFFGLAVGGLVVDLRLRLLRPQPTPQLPWVILFFAWAILTAVLKSPVPGEAIFMISILFVWFYLISQGLSGLRTFRALYGALLAFSTYLAAVGVHQNFCDTGCVQIEGFVGGLPSSQGIPDGRPCRKARDCYTGRAEPGKEYLCEKVGLFGTSSITMRVRYLGIFQDPNDLALTVAAALPFLFAMVSIRPGARRIAIAALCGALILLCIYFSKSRGGQLVLVSILGCYFVRRYRFRGLILAATIGALLFAAAMRGRSGEAEQSSSERMQHMYEGMTMVKENPVMGVGADCFTLHHYMTAHNAYVLTAAELGVVGMFFWIAILYTSMKIPIVALIRYRDGSAPEDIRHWAMAVLAALVGTYVGVFFLSFTWHYMLWCYKALSGALYRVLAQHDPGLRVRFGFIDALAVVALTAGTLLSLYLLTRLLVTW